MRILHPLAKMANGRSRGKQSLSWYADVEVFAQHLGRRAALIVTGKDGLVSAGSFCAEQGAVGFLDRKLHAL